MKTFLMIAFLSSIISSVLFFFGKNYDAMVWALIASVFILGDLVE